MNLGNRLVKSCYSFSLDAHSLLWPNQVPQHTTLISIILPLCNTHPFAHSASVTSISFLFFNILLSQPSFIVCSFCLEWSPPRYWSEVIFHWILFWLYSLYLQPFSSTVTFFFISLFDIWYAMVFDIQYCMGFPGGSDTKESACNAGDTATISGLRRSPGAGNGNPLQYYCLENSMDKGA